MLSVILTILKILGIILLVILGLILALVLVILFVPIRYRSKGYVEKTDEGINDKILVKVSWLLHIVSVRFELDGKEGKLVVKIFGKELNLNSGAKKAKQDTAKTVNTNKPREMSETYDSNVGSFEKVDNKLVEKEQPVKAIEEKEPVKDKEKKTFRQKLADALDKIKAICEKIKHINHIKNAFLEYLRRDESKIAIREIKKIIFKALRHILPQRFKADIWFGFDDPATTGNVLGILSIFYGIYRDKINLNPNFQNQELKLRYELKGRIRIFTLLMAALKIYKNKWIREFIAFSKDKLQ